MTRILIIDDDEMFCRVLTTVLKLDGNQILCAHTLGEGLRLVSSEYLDVVFLDVHLPDGNGLDQLSEILIAPSQPEVIILTGEGTPDGAELAIERGAWDYIQKPSSVGGMRLHLARALQYRAERQKRTLSSRNLMFEGILGNSAKMKDCHGLVFEVASSDINVLITGETGTGKELFARAIHKNSRRAHKNFIVVDCAALQGGLIESTLFGHEKGSFTGADKSHEGLIKQCDGGTLFLDEIGELPLTLQKVFLRVLQEHRFRPLGSSKEIESNFRLITATNRNINDMVTAGQFRQDLLYRFCSQVIHLPPLRERGEDIIEIATYHAAKICKRNGIDDKLLSPDFTDALLAYHWPGNIRELVNAVDRAIAGSLSTPTLFQRHLPRAIRVQLAQSLLNSPLPIDSASGIPPSHVWQKLKDVREATYAAVEKKYLQDLIKFTAHQHRKLLMSCLLYLSANADLEDRLLKIITAFAPQSHFEICRSLPDFSNRSRLSFPDIRVMVLCIECTETLDAIITHGDFLMDKKIILVLPDEEKDTMSKAFTLSPRFITWIDSNFKDLGNVLSRMIALYDICPFADERTDMHREAVR